MQTKDRASWPPLLAGPTVLIVDDESGIRDFLRSAFQADGYTVLAAGDGEAALQVCDLDLPDVILLDLMMPKLDGLGFLHEFRRRHGVDACPIIIMSAVSTAVQHAEAAGVTGAVVKPFDLEELIDMVEDAVGRQRVYSGQRPA